MDLSLPGESATSPKIAVGDDGDAAAVWQRAFVGVQGAARPAGGAWQDPVDPRIPARPLGVPGGRRSSGLVLPASGVAGQPMAFSVSPFDALSVPGAASWSFGDGFTVRRARLRGHRDVHGRGERRRRRIQPGRDDSSIAIAAAPRHPPSRGGACSRRGPGRSASWRGERDRVRRSRSPPFGQCECPRRAPGMPPA